MSPTAPEAFTGWRKSSHSGANHDCVEVGRVAHVIGVRDTKQNGCGPILEFGPSEWRLFLDQIKNGGHQQ